MRFLKSSETQRQVARSTVTDISKGEVPPPSFRPWICRNYVLPKQWQLFTGPWGMASHKTAIFISTTVRTSYLALRDSVFTIGTHMRSCRKYMPKWPNNNNHEVDIRDYWMIISAGIEKRTTVVIIIISIIANVGVIINRQKHFLLKILDTDLSVCFTIKQTPVLAAWKQIFRTNLFESTCATSLRISTHKKAS